MGTFTLGVTLRNLSSWDDAAAARVADALGGEGAVWVDAGDPALLRISLERTADDLPGALAQGRGLGLQLRDRALVPAGVLEVSAMDDEDVMVWRAEA